MSKVMPKPKDKYKRFLISNIEYQCSLRGIDTCQQRIIARCSKSTYDRRRKDPGCFTVDELIRLSHKIGVPLWKLFKEEE